MGLYSSYSQVFVSNSPAILAQGKTVDALAVGQIGFLDAKTYTAVAAPTYAKNKALYAVWGTADVSIGYNNDFAGMPNENEYSKIIKGKLIKKFRAKKAQRAQTPLYTIGWSGDVADTDSLFADVNQSKSLFIKLSGTVIDRLYDKQGVVKEFLYTPACVDNCTDTCTTVNPADIAIQLADNINSDKDFKKFIKAKAILSPAPDPDTSDCFTYTLSVCDTGDARSYGIVQSQYPNETVTVINRIGAITTYGVVKDTESAPADFSGPAVVVPDCPSCDLGTLVNEAIVYEVRTVHSVTASNVHSAFTAEVDVVLLNTDPNFNTFTVVFPTTKADSAVQSEAVTAGYTATLIGTRRNICSLSPVTTAWVEGDQLLRQDKTYTITLADSVCGTNRLTDLQAAYPLLTIAVVNSAGSCVHSYSTTVASNCYATGCAIESITWVKPPMFEGAQWIETPADNSSVTLAGIQLETAFVFRSTNECTFDAFPYENDIVHIQISNYNPDFNASPCEDSWVVKQIRQVKYPQGHGAYVQHLEKESKQYDQRFRSWDPVVREVQGYSLQTDPTKYYDQYVLEYDTKWKSSGGWSEDYTQGMFLTLFVQEGTGAAIEAALNSYITSAGIEEDGTAI